MSDALPSLVERAFTLMVRRARWLGRLPGLPQFADAFCQAAVAVTDPGRLRAMRAVERQAAHWSGVTCGLHRFGGVEFRADGREFAHLHGCGLLDGRVGRDQARTCIAAGQAEPHHVFGDSAWVSFWVRGAREVPGALKILQLAQTQCSPPPYLLGLS